MQNNIIHKIEFSVQKYGSKKEQDDYRKNVTEDNLADVTVFEFGISMSDEIFENSVFENEIFEVEGAKILKY